MLHSQYLILVVHILIGHLKVLFFFIFTFTYLLLTCEQSFPLRVLVRDATDGGRRGGRRRSIGRGQTRGRRGVSRGVLVPRWAGALLQVVRPLGRVGDGRRVARLACPFLKCNDIDEKQYQGY